jgi:hypothetical protein
LLGLYSFVLQWTTKKSGNGRRKIPRNHKGPSSRMQGKGGVQAWLDISRRAAVPRQVSQQLQHE